MDPLTAILMVLCIVLGLCGMGVAVSSLMKKREHVRKPPIKMGYSVWPEKLCPFCGGRPTLAFGVRDGYEGYETDPDAIAWYVRCISCAAQGGWAKSKAGAWRLWNMREKGGDRKDGQSGEEARSGERL